MMTARQRDQQEPKQVKAKKKGGTWDWFLKKFDDGTYQTNHIELRARRERRINK